MATMVISDATNMKIAARKAALQNLRSKINNKTRQEIACKLIILRTTCFLHQNTSQLLWFKEKTLLQSKFCCKLKSSISKVSKRGEHSVVRLKKKRGGTAIIRTQKSATA